MKKSKSIVLILVCTICLNPALTNGETAVDESYPKTVIIVRHAEKTAEPKNDPVLNAEGEARAQRLAGMLAKTDVTNVYASQFQRTQLTVKPLADMLGLKVEVVGAKDYASLTQRILMQDGHVAVVAAHSNTMHQIVKALGGPEWPEVSEADYENIFVVTVSEPGKAVAINLRF